MCLYRLLFKMLFLPNITTSPSLLALQIADRGVRALVKVLDSDNVVTFLNLQDNQVSCTTDRLRAVMHDGLQNCAKGVLAAMLCSVIWRDVLLHTYRCMWKVDRRLQER